MLRRLPETSMVHGDAFIQKRCCHAVALIACKQRNGKIKAFETPIAAGGVHGVTRHGQRLTHKCFEQTLHPQDCFAVANRMSLEINGNGTKMRKSTAGGQFLKQSPDSLL